MARGGAVSAGTIALPVLLACGWAATAAPAVSQGSEEPLRIDGEVVIGADAGEVWAALTTAEGLSGWIAPDSRVELRLGGPYELYFNPDAVDRGMEGTRVLAFVPGEMLATSGDAPGTWSVWRLDGVGEGATRVRFTGLGTGREWAERVAYFREVTPHVPDRLRAYVESGGEPATAAVRGGGG